MWGYLSEIRPYLHFQLSRTDVKNHRGSPFLSCKQKHLWPAINYKQVLHSQDRRDLTGCLARRKLCFGANGICIFFFITRGAETGCLTLSSTKCHLGSAVYSSSLLYTISLMCPYNNQHVISTETTPMRSKWFSFFDICCFFPVSSPEKKKIS